MRAPTAPRRGWPHPHRTRPSLASGATPAAQGGGRLAGSDLHGLHRRRRALRPHGVPPMRPQRPEAAPDVTRPVAELRRRPARRPDQCHADPGLRPRGHPLRPGQQLRPAYGSAETNFGQVMAAPGPLPRRADHLHQGGLRHVARALRRRGLAQVPAGQSGRQPRADGSRLRGHLLRAPVRPRDPAGGDHGGPGHRRAPGQGPLRRDLVLPPGADARGGGHPGPAGHPLLIHQPSYSMFNRWIEQGLLDTIGELGLGCIVFSPWPRACSPTATWTGYPRDRGPASRARSTRGGSTSRPWPRCGRSTPWPSAGGRPWPRWPWPGRCAIPG